MLGIKHNDAETLDLVTPASLSEKCLENVDLKPDFPQVVSIRQSINKVSPSYTAMTMTPILSRTAYQNNRLKEYMSTV